ncbi:hypothetical protein BHM03_00060854 [Ensete ventricosum]|nr:hypothetical protein BHM03_00060854 [Ensete ventricosum]
MQASMRTHGRPTSMRTHGRPTALLVVALFTEVELPTAPDHSHDHVPLHGTHCCLHLNIRFSQMVARAGCPPHNPARSPTFVCTYACPSTKVSLRRDLLCSLRLIKEKTGHKK